MAGCAQNHNVYLLNTFVGELKNGGVLEIPVEVGTHMLFFKEKRKFGKKADTAFEVVVNEPKGLHKIFDNLVIISNNVEPESLEIEITGDVYGFNKEQIFKSNKELHKINIIPAKDVKNNSIINENGDKVAINDRLAKQVNTRVHWDPIENSYSLAVHQDMINIKDYGRRLGNIYYNEDK